MSITFWGDYSGISLSCPENTTLRGITIKDEKGDKQTLPLNTKQFAWLKLNYDIAACLVEIKVNPGKL